jgi:hypothetical protein
MVPSQDSIIGAYPIEMTARWIEQQGLNAALKHLEEIEPAIAAYAIAAALRIGRELSMHNLPNRAIEHFEGSILLALLVAIEATRQAGRQLWESMLAELPEGIDPEEYPF